MHLGSYNLFWKKCQNYSQTSNQMGVGHLTIYIIDPLCINMI